MKESDEKGNMEIYKCNIHNLPITGAFKSAGAAFFYLNALANKEGQANINIICLFQVILLIKEIKEQNST